MKFLENIFLNFFLKKIWESLNFSSYSNYFIEIFLKILFQLILLNHQFYGFSSVLFNIISFSFERFLFIIIASFKIIFILFVKLIKFLYYLVVNIKNIFIEMKTNMEILKNQKNIRSNKIFNDEQLIILEEWLDLHKNHPYASNHMKKELAEKTQLTFEQVSI
jgi:hypothetical protein